MPTINRFVGAETGGLEESATAYSGWSASYQNASILINDLYHYHGEGGAFSLPLTFKMTDYVAFEDTNLIVSLALEFTAWPAADSETVVTVGKDISISVSTSGTLTLLDSNDGSLDTFAASLNTLYEIEIYLQKANASGAWEWRINGTSQGSGTGADLLNASSDNNLTFSVQDGSIVMDVNNIVVRSGCTTSDWLGTGISVCALAAPLGTPTEGGDTLTSGAMINTQNIPLDTAEAQFDAGTARSRWIQSDGVRYFDRYYFDASDAGPTDNDGVWTDDSLAFDIATSNNANTSSTGTETTNELRGEGTNAPSTLDIVIDHVDLELDFLCTGGGTFYARIYVDGGTELISDQSFTTSITGSYTVTRAISTPSGGWTWEKLAGLEIVYWNGSYSTIGIARALLQVYVLQRTPAELGLTNTIACKVFMDS